MKFTLIIASTLLFASSIMAAPVAESNLPSASIGVTNITAPSSTAKPINDAMSGAIATASISVDGQNVTAQSSGSERTFIGASMALPIAVISAIFLI